MALLEIKDLTRRFGGLVAVNEVNFEVEEGIILGVIGPNGAGKTTLFNLITGVFKPTSGKVIFKGKDVTRLSTHRRASRGLVRTFQTTSLYHEMTVSQNVEVAHHLFRKSRGPAQLVTTPGFRKEDRRVKEKVAEMLDYFGLSAVKDELAKNLPHGHQRILGVAIAVASGPELLLLDEPVTGMNETETATMTSLIRGLRDDMGITIVLVEHDMKAVMSLSEYIIVFDFGKKIAEGAPSEVANNKAVIEAYLGTEEGM